LHPGLKELLKLFFKGIAKSLVEDREIEEAT